MEQSKYHSLTFYQIKPQKWWILSHLSLTFWILHNKTSRRNFSGTKKEKNKTVFEVFKYWEYGAACCQATSPHLLIFFFFRKSLSFISSIIQLLLCIGWDISLFILSPCPSSLFNSKSYQDYCFLKSIFSKNLGLISPEK